MTDKRDILCCTPETRINAVYRVPSPDELARFEINLPTRVIFLDIDGVLNSVKQITETNDLLLKKEISDSHAYHAYEVPGYAQSMSLASILQAVPDSAIVISSSWRAQSQNASLWGYLLHLASNREAGFDVHVTEATTGYFTDSGCRGDEIAAWLRNHPEVVGYVILDDKDDMGALSERLVQTTYATGLTPNDAVKAIKILKQDINPKEETKHDKT